MRDQKSVPGTNYLNLLDHVYPQSGLRILFMVPFAPRLDAAHGGGRSVAQLIINLTQRHQVALCCLRTPNELPVDDDLRECCDVVEELMIPEITGSGLKEWMYRLWVWQEMLKGKPLWAIGRSTPEYATRLFALAKRWRPDVIQLEFHIMGQYLKALDGIQAPRVLVNHDPGEKAAFERHQAHAIHGLFMPFLDLITWQRFERAVLRQVQAVVVFTEKDRVTLSSSCRNTLLVRIPLGTKLPEQPLDSIGSEPPMLLFVGNFQHMPNVDAAERLIHWIFPSVHAQFPNTHLTIIGDNAPPELSSLSFKNISVTGFVPDVTPYMDQAALFVAPLRYGGGMRVKVLEALAGGKAVVASHLAAEGLDLINGEQLVLADTDEEFVQAIIKLLDSPKQRSMLGRRARAWASDNLGWEKVVSNYENLYQHLL